MGDKHKIVKQSSFQVCPEKKSPLLSCTFWDGGGGGGGQIYELVWCVLACKLLGGQLNKRGTKGNKHHQPINRNGINYERQTQRSFSLSIRSCLLRERERERERSLTVIKTWP